MDETLVHSTFTESEGCDFSVLVREGVQEVTLNVYVRPGTLELIQTLGPHYEIVIFTASGQEYADRVIDRIDTHKLVRHRLYKESCLLINECRVKDLALLNRKLEKVIILDNSPMSYFLQPNNSIGISTWMSDKSDRELYHVTEMLMEMKDIDNVYTELRARENERKRGQ